MHQYELTDPVYTPDIIPNPPHTKGMPLILEPTAPRIPTGKSAKSDEQVTPVATSTISVLLVNFHEPPFFIPVVIMTLVAVEQKRFKIKQ